MPLGDDETAKGLSTLTRPQALGPNALKVVEKATGKPVPDVKFFNMTDASARIPVRLLCPFRAAPAQKLGEQLSDAAAGKDEVRRQNPPAGFQK